MAVSEKTMRPSGILRWLGGGRRGLEGYLYVIHRISGLALLMFLMMHVFFTGVRLLGEEAWSGLMEMANNPVLHFLEYLVYVAFAFHAVNGLRLIIIELAFGIGPPDEPVYPYKGSIHKQRPLMLIAMVIVGILIFAGGFDLVAMGH
ncbi:MAG: hypothetical protein QNJ40_04110 [Xanthomonadales bacterium]|nr:hypothetical protein [Xanthomonadales bacterium]